MFSGKRPIQKARRNRILDRVYFKGLTILLSFGLEDRHIPNFFTYVSNKGNKFAGTPYELFSFDLLKVLNFDKTIAFHKPLLKCKVDFANFLEANVETILVSLLDRERSLKRK